MTDDAAPGWPFVGNALDLTSANSIDMIHIFRTWAEKYGPITQISLMGAKQVILSEERVAHELFVKRGNRYSDRGAPHAVEYISMKQSPGFRNKDGKLCTPLNSYRSSIIMTNRGLAPPEKDATQRCLHGFNH